MSKPEQKPTLNKKWIDHDAYEIVKALQKKSFTCYLVGGCVRDLLLGIAPKDFDIVTNAKPRDIKKAVRNCYIIGRRFRLVLARRKPDKLFEIATFRRKQTQAELDDENLTGDNAFGNPEQDAGRRDFSVNTLFYDPVAEKLIDYCNAETDFESRVIKMIGDPSLRLKEDPIRILRAIRLAYKISFSIDPELRSWMKKDAETLVGSALPRRREEYLKFLRLKDPILAFYEAYDLDVLKYIAPELHDAMENEDFELAFRNFYNKFLDKSNPVELFGHLAYIYIRNVIHKDPNKELRVKDILEHPKIMGFMRDQLGMFKYEQRYVAKAFQLQNILHKREEFERRGEKRRQAILKNEAFPLALDFARNEYRLPAGDLLFWEKEFTRFQKNKLSSKSN